MALASSPDGAANPSPSKLIPSLLSHSEEPELKFMLLCDLDTSVSQFSCL